MSNLSPHIRELNKTLAPEYGPETPSEAVSRLLEHYQRLDEQGQLAFVAALIGDAVTQRMIARPEPRQGEAA